MGFWLWSLLFAIHTGYCWWIIGYGGAKRVAGWRAFFLINWFAFDWNADQIRMYALLIWLVSLFFFMMGAINPEYRFI